MPDINISVKNKIAVQTDKAEYICGNSDFVVKFDFDSEWDVFEAKTARFKYNGAYKDVVFSGDQCAIPIISNANDISVGVYAGNLHTTTPALVLCEKSILCGSGFPADPPDDVYNQIMELIQGLGTPDAEAIAKAVADYLTEHPFEETDPTVPEWAKTDEKPTYTAEEVGAIADTELQTAIDSALAQAKESGEFDGAPGAKGDTGATGATGATPNLQIGTVTTLDAGADATATITGTEENPLLNLGIPKGAKGNDGASMGITGATVGQIAKITSVDSDGKPTAWSPVDMPSGAAEKSWTKIIDVSVTEATAKFEQDGLDNDTEFFIKWSNLQNATTTNSAQDLYINNVRVATGAINVNKSGATIYGWTWLKYNGLVWIITKSAGAILDNNTTLSDLKAPYNTVDGVGMATTIKFVTPNSIYAPITGKLEVWAR